MADTTAQLDLLITRYLDGGEPEDRAALNDLMRHDPAARAAFIEHCRLAALVFECPRTQSKSIPASPMASLRAVGVYAAAAMIALAVTAWFILQPGPQTSHVDSAKPIVAMLTNTDGAVFDNQATTGGGSDAMTLGSELSAGLLKLTAGSAQIMFNSTAVVDLVGPCEFEMVGPNRGRLAAGSMSAYVPEAAHGFVVEAPAGQGTLSVVDLGTRFGLDVVPAGVADLRDGCSIVRVVEGEVELRYTDASRGVVQHRRLRAAEGMVVHDGRFEMMTPLIRGEVDPLAGAGAMTAATEGPYFVADTLSLHPNEFSQFGAVVTRRAMPLAAGASDFVCTFEFEFADGQGTGADWLKFFIAADPPTGNGASGRDAPSPQVFGITFDSYRNAEAGDPSAAFVDVITPNNPRLARIDLAALPFGLRDLTDSGSHRVRVWCISGRLSVSLDGQRIVRNLPVKLTDSSGGPLSAVWLGFGARTGGSSELHLVRDCWFAALGPDTNHADSPENSNPSERVGNLRTEIRHDSE
ncbi:hypothetical protein HED60_09620 [Planctomycetales bacterium ZRK34]|nr:hypothetical protein HED60_09620 [Planctomycetales bacterium ZRK34]